MSKRTPSDIELSTKFWVYLHSLVQSRPMRKTKLSGSSVSTERTGVSTDRIPLSFCQVSDDLPEMSNAAMKLVFLMVKELVYGNFLWHFDSENRKNYTSAIAELRKLKVLIKTSNSSVHIVNPLYISKGEALIVGGHSTFCIAEEHKACVEAIRAKDSSAILVKSSTLAHNWNPFSE